MSLLSNLFNRYTDNLSSVLYPRVYREEITSLENQGRVQGDMILGRANQNRLKQIPWAAKSGMENPIENVYFPAKRAGLDPRFVDAVAQTESNYRPRNSHMGAVGHMQVMPQTAKDLGFTGTPEQLAVPKTNFEYGNRYLNRIRDLRGDLTPLEWYHRYVHGASTQKPVAPEMPYAQNFMRYYR